MRLRIGPSPFDKRRAGEIEPAPPESAPSQRPDAGYSHDDAGPLWSAVTRHRFFLTPTCRRSEAGEAQSLSRLLAQASDATGALLRAASRGLRKTADTMAGKPAVGKAVTSHRTP